MRKTTIVKLFVGSLIGLAAGVVLFLIAGAVAIARNGLVMNGPDVVGVTPSVFGWSMAGLGIVALLAMISAGVLQLVAWIGAAINTAALADKTWFVVVLVLGLLGLGFPVLIAYAIAGPDGTAVPPTNPPVEAGSERALKPHVPAA